MALTHIPFPMLPVPPSWFPGHMMKFTRMLPTLLTRTDVVLELRDARLPLTSINRTLEGSHSFHISKPPDASSSMTSHFGLVVVVKVEYESIRSIPNTTSLYFTGARIIRTVACERIVVFNKRDLVPEWGLEPFRKAMANKFPTEKVFFASWQRPRDIRNLSELLVNIAKEHPHAIELNVLVIGMPNVGKSTLLNALRNMGIKGRTPNALGTSAQPGLTQALSTRLKLSLDPLVYAFDSPGVMLPFLGRGEEGAERGVKLALIAGIKEGLYDIEALAAYLLYRLNLLNPISPAYLRLLPPGTAPTTDLEQFLSMLADRMGMRKRGSIMDTGRAAIYFVKWWREEGGLIAAASASALDSVSQGSPSVPGYHNGGWGFDFQWTVTPEEARERSGKGEREKLIQEKMEGCIDEYMEMMARGDEDENNVSATQTKKKKMFEEKIKRKERSLRKKNS